MPMQFTVANQAGNAAKVDTPTLVNQLQKGGYNPTGVSADGMHIQMDDGDGQPYQVPAEKVLQNFGWKVSGYQPKNVDYDNVEPGLRFGISNLPEDDAMRRSYIEGTMKGRGIEQPQVVGSGRDWYVFNPGTSQYVALTNSPKLGMADMAEAAQKIPRGIVSTMGGAAGFAVGGGSPLSVAGAAAGAGLAGGAWDTAQRTALAADDPAYRHVAEENMGKMGTDVGINAGIDALTGGAFAGAPMAARGLFGRGAEELTRAALEAGPVSTAARAAGAGMKTAGGLAQGAGKMLDNPMGHDLVAGFIPGVSDLQNLGWALQAPEALVSMGARGAGMLGDSSIAREAIEGAARLRNVGSGQMARDADVLRDALGGHHLYMSPEEVDNFANVAAQAQNKAYGQSVADTTLDPIKAFSQRVLAKRAGVAGAEESSADEASRLFRMRARPLGPDVPPGFGQSDNAANTFGNLGEMAGGAVDKMTASMRQTAMRRAQLKAMTEATQSGAELPAAIGAGQQAALSAAPSRAARWGHIGQNIGGYAARAAELGRGADRVARGVGGGVVKTIRWGGAGTKATGTALNSAGRFAQPLENQMLMRLGAEESAKPALERRVNPWLDQAGADTIDDKTQLAGNY